jgi:glycosyltransferase involved in cell wall biosynthesis
LAEHAADLAPLVARLAELEVRRIHSFAWRDLDDPEAGGSEVHADEIFRRWVAAGLRLEHRTSTFDQRRQFTRNGYGVTQAGGRLGVLARTPLHEVVRGGRRDADAVIDIWNGVPWWSPLWFRGPRVTWLHHVHGPMWRQSFPAPAAAVGRTMEARVASRVYRRESVVTLSESSRAEIEHIGIRVEGVHVIEPGISAMFVPDAARRSPTPLVVAVGRLAPVKRYLDLVAAMAVARRSVPDLAVEIVGEGPDREPLQQWIAANDAHDWVKLRGRISDAEVVDTYQRAWLVVSASIAEGWGMALTEAAACGTPSLATDIAGHRDSVRTNVSGILVAQPADLADAAVRLLQNPVELARLSAGASAMAAELTWDRAAARHLQVLVDVAQRHRGRASRY